MTAARHVFAVLGPQQGSGVLLTPHLVLTSAHVVGENEYAGVAAIGRAGPLALRVIRSDDELDFALLHSEEPLGPAPVLGALATDRPVPGCEILGFPRIQRYEGQRLDLDQFTGTALPMAGLVRRTLSVELDGPPVTADEHGPSPLAGLSGAPVYADDGLIGIVRAVPRGRGHRRLECVPLSAVLEHPDVRRLLPRDFAPPAPVTRTHPGDRPYEREYADALGVAYRRTKIFGLDELDRRASEWDLDTAYLSLEAAARNRGGAEPVPHRIDELLAARPRVLIRGDAGAGKTTLLWWLAAHAAAGTLGPHLAELNGLVPFVVPLRTLRARDTGFPGLAELPGVAGLVVDAAPGGWAGRVLAAGRGLLLVDGLDEVPQEEREAAHAWLSGLLARYPRTRCVATVRPLAVDPDWLGSENFEELTLLPMRDADIQAFVAAWHAAARLDDVDPAGLDVLERDLALQFSHNPVLADLARTPLLCAVICALHRLREGFLPDTRWALYQSALQLLLGDRDKRRRIDAPDGIRMSVEEHLQLLQRIAAWLVRGGQTEFTRQQALHQLARALPGMPRVAAQGTPTEILTHLLNRSGLLQERADDVFQFAHRTFQDFLAAKEFVEDDLVHEMLQHVRDQQWHDVLLLAAGHCSRRELPFLVEGVLEAGSAVRDRGRKTTLYVLAARCAQHAAWLSEPLHARVRKAVKSVLPPRNATQLPQLAALGPYLLPLLPSPEKTPKDALTMIVSLICEVGGSEAVPYARDFAGSDPTATLAVNWARFPTQLYAREVLSRADLANAVLLVSEPDQLPLLRTLPQARRLYFRGSFDANTLTDALTGRTADTLVIRENGVLGDLGFLRSCGRDLRTLRIDQCPHVQIAALTGLDSLDELHLVDQRLGAGDLEAVAKLSGLAKLYLVPEAADGGLDLTPLHAASRRLHVHAFGVPERRITGRAALGSRLTVHS
ncbi:MULTISPECIES: NACHT domain-containing protein [Streptomyces]|uniref:NACHT domain-containing protein n=1 Tax=Streptomyces solicathayae TaxID=3081768 RepID=A0ABZ0LVU6_9ACTN|nr:NACHT domain-containing protein [Streptomyces sp. HUAS YS2]WOX22903.1 NACHT domain-containing protein [Streptomyces sp. HUAS YS2]